MQERIYYLDVLRALAITLVFTAHTVLSFGSPVALKPLQYGGTGVDLFFLLSGWLIGFQLFSEEKKFSNIDIRRFWVRRWMRTMPAYFAVLFVTLTQLYLTKDSVSNPLPYFLFIQNYFHPLDYFSISWSLSVEEQFYLVIAPLLFFISRFNLGFQTVFLLTLLILPTCFRALGWYDSHNETHVRWDCCLMGVLLAHLYHKRAALWLRLLPFKGTMLIVGTMAYLSFYYFRLEPPYAGYSDPSKLLLAIVFASLVFYAVNTPVLHKPIGFNTIMHVSTRSYSIYLVHPEALAFCKRFLEGSDFLTFYLVAIGLTLIISEVLYRTVEVTFITMRSKYKFSSKRMA